jgi:hypothetical protein
MSNESGVTPPTKSEIQKSIGATLTERRKMRGLSLEKAGQMIRVRASIIKAIEDGEWQLLPGEVYARGFVIRYAQAIGLTKDILDPYLKITMGEGGNPVRPASSSTMSSEEWPKSVLVWAGVGLVAAVVIIKVMMSDHRAARQVTNAKDMDTKAPISSPVKEKEPAPQAAKPAVQHTLEVFSPFPLWLSVKADNRSFEGFIPQGSTWSWKGDGQFTVRVGHTQQVALAFDGRVVSLSENQKKVMLPSEN